MSSNPLNLSDNEMEARDLFLKIYSAYDKPIDCGIPGDLKLEIPEWFDELKFKKGQNFFNENLLGNQLSHMYGTVCLLGDPAGLAIIRMTNKSNTEETARKRHVETMLHTSVWYNQELKSDSAAWKSLNRVRLLHLHATKQAMKKEVGVISQSEVAMALYIFIGFSIGLPHSLGINPADKEGRAGFIHFWAVMGYMLGLEDQYNFCIKDMDVVEIIIDIFTRYFFIPLLQIETTDFKQSLQAYCLGMDYFFHNIKYDSLLFLTRRALGIPGYQYSVDTEHLKIIKDIFTVDEISQLRKYMARNKQMQQFPDIYLDIHPHILLQVSSGTKLKPNERFLSEKERIGLGYEIEETVIKRTVPYAQWSSEFSDSKFHKLSEKGKEFVRAQCSLIKQSGWFYMRWIVFVVGKYTEYRLWWWHGKKSKVPLYR